MKEGEQTPKQEKEGEAVDTRAPHAQAERAGQPLVWYCPSRWLLAHNDTRANICTQSSHMCLADLNNDGENLLALVDFKDAVPAAESTAELVAGSRPPYACRMRVYRGQQLIYNHFLDDIPSSLIATSINLYELKQPTNHKLGDKKWVDTMKRPIANKRSQPLLTLTINEDVYFYQKLRPLEKLSLEDDERILDSLNKSEVDAWEMARKGQIDDGTMRELLMGVRQELGTHALTSHSNNFIALASSDERKQYLHNWKRKGLAQTSFSSSSSASSSSSSSTSSSKSRGGQLMSMDTICCAAARLRFSSTLTMSGDYGQTREPTTIMNTAKWNKIMDTQRDGLVLGTEDRHLLIYVLRDLGTHLESHRRLPAVPDHILVERRSPASFDATATGTDLDLRKLTYKILVSCRNRKIYSLNQPYLDASDGTTSVRLDSCNLRELVALKSNVLEMSWTGMNESIQRDGGGASAEHHHRPTFVVACLDRRFYCFSSHSGQCKWVMDMELPITCMVCLPKLIIGSDEASLVGVASQANRFDFYVASTGRIVDSIYFQDDFPVAAKFGRFGREDNCLCLTTQRGHLLVFILKRTAKFAHGQCLSSAASYASDTLASCGQILRQQQQQQSVLGKSSRAAAAGAAVAQTGAHHAETEIQACSIAMSGQVNLPSAFALSKTHSAHATDKILESLILSHDCDQVTAKNALDSHASRPQLQIPMKGRDFVNHIVDQSRQSRQSGRLFAQHMVSLRDEVKASLVQHPKTGNFDGEEGNRVSLTKIIGLGSVYRVSLAFRLNVEKFITRYHELLNVEGYSTSLHKSTSWRLTCYLRPKNDVQNRSCQIRPFKIEMPIEKDTKADLGIKSILETSIIFKLLIQGQNFEALDGDNLAIEVKVIAHNFSPLGVTTVQRPLYLATINVQLRC